MARERAGEAEGRERERCASGLYGAGREVRPVCTGEGGWEETPRSRGLGTWRCTPVRRGARKRKSVLSCARRRGERPKKGRRMPQIPSFQREGAKVGTRLAQILRGQPRAPAVGAIVRRRRDPGVPQRRRAWHQRAPRRVARVGLIRRRTGIVRSLPVRSFPSGLSRARPERRCAAPRVRWRPSSCRRAQRSGQRGASAHARGRAGNRTGRE